MDGTKLNINFAEQPTVQCEECGNKFFKKVTVMKKISRLLTGASQDEIVPLETYACDKCSHVNKDFNPFEDEE